MTYIRTLVYALATLPVLGLSSTVFAGNCASVNFSQAQCSAILSGAESQCLANLQPAARSEVEAEAHAGGYFPICFGALLEGWCPCSSGGGDLLSPGLLSTTPPSNGGGFGISASTILVPLQGGTTFSSQCSDGSNVQAINWDFGDGSQATGYLVDHAFGHEGQFNVSARCVLNNGETMQSSLTVVVMTNPPVIPH